MKRELPRVIFLHIPKTGGSTLREVLRIQYPFAEVYAGVAESHPGRYVEYLEGRRDLGEEGDRNAPHLKLWEALDPEKAARTRLFLGHFWYGVHERFPSPAEYVTVLRDPIDRMLSLHHHRATQQGLQQSLADWIVSGREREQYGWQTCRIAGVTEDVRVRSTDTMLDVAKEHLVEKFAVVGVTERFEESLVALVRRYAFSSVGGGMWLNRSEGRAPRAAVSPELLDILCERCVHDIELHRFANERLDDALVGVDVDHARQQLRRLAPVTEMRRFVKRAESAVRRRGRRARQTLQGRLGRA